MLALVNGMGVNGMGAVKLSIYGIHSIYTPFSIYIVYMILYVLADMCIFV